MRCEEIAEILPIYAMNELSEKLAGECRAHVEICAKCSEALEEYRTLIMSISECPEIVPSWTETVEVRRALGDMARDRAANRSAATGLPGFTAASLGVFAFLVVALLKGFVSLDTISVANLSMVLLIGLVVVFVTTFIPIAVISQRKRLNGMSFRR